MLDYDEITELVLKMRDEQLAKDRRRNIMLKRSAVMALSACAAGTVLFLHRSNTPITPRNENNNVISENIQTSAEQENTATTVNSETTTAVSVSSKADTNTTTAIAAAKNNTSSEIASITQTVAKPVTTVSTSVLSPDISRTSAAVITTFSMTSENAAPIVTTSINVQERSFDMKKLMAFAASLTILTSAAESPLASADTATDINDISNAELTIFSEMDNENTDINMDGKFDVKDTYEFLAYMYGYDTDEAVEKNILANADYDGNGTVEKNDAELLLKYLIHKNLYKNEHLKPSFYESFEKKKTEQGAPIYGSANPDAVAELNSEDFDKGAYTPEELEELFKKADEQTIIGYETVEYSFNDMFISYLTMYLNDLSEPYPLFCKFVKNGNIDLDIDSDGNITLEDINIYNLYINQRDIKISIEKNHQWINSVLPYDADPEGLLELRSADFVTAITDEQWAKCEANYDFFISGLKMYNLENHAIRYIIEKDGKPDDKHFDSDYYADILDGSEKLCFGETVRSVYDSLFPEDEKMTMFVPEHSQYLNQYCEGVANKEITVPDANGDGTVDFKDILITSIYMSEHKRSVSREDSCMPDYAWDFFENKLDINENGVCGDFSDISIYQLAVYVYLDVNDQADSIQQLDRNGHAKCLIEYRKELEAEKNTKSSDTTIEPYLFNNDLSILSKNTNISRSGDANCDNGVDLADSVTIMQSIANPDKYTMSTTGSFNADVSHTGDGITLEDALTIQKELLFRE